MYPDCRKFGLSYRYIEIEKRVKLSNFEIWNEGARTQKVNELNSFVNG
jgi:hypothetical protein